MKKPDDPLLENDGLQARDTDGPLEATGPDRDLAALEGELRRWGRRPPRTSPADAARRILTALEPRRRFHFPLRLAFASVAGTVLAVGLWLAMRNGENGAGRVEAPSAPAAPAAGAAAAPLEENVVLWWLDPDTPVYFVLGPPEAQPGEGS